MTGVSDTAAQAAIGAAARELKLPTVRDQAARLAEIAVRERHTHLAYLAEVSAAAGSVRCASSTSISDRVPAVSPWARRAASQYR